MQVKVTMERLKVGWEDTLHEREEFSERKIKNMEEQKDKGVYLVLIYFLMSLVFQHSFVCLHRRMNLQLFVTYSWCLCNIWQRSVAVFSC